MSLRLRELEIYGFKSFGEKTFLAFPSNLNVIVGGNGCGKSNLVESIRWVLGDQSFRNLRISEASDLLFVGQKLFNLTRVRINLESETDAFEIERKIHRNGENEYFLNQASVRLKDIQKFLAENQIGTKGFTIVNQGSPDLFIKASPEERYVMLGEILGTRGLEIKKFETKKNLEQIKERLKIAKMKLNMLEPQLEVFLREKQKKERAEEIEKKLDGFFSEIQAKRKFLLQERLRALELEIQKIKQKQGETEKELETFSQGIKQASSQEHLAELRKKEVSLLEKRNAILEKNLPRLLPAVQKNKEINILNFIQEKLFLALGLKTIDEIKKIIKEILNRLEAVSDKQRQSAHRSPSIAKGSVQSEIKQIDQALQAIKAEIVQEEKRQKEEQEKINKNLFELKEIQNKIFELKHLEEKLLEENQSIEITVSELKTVEEQKATSEELGVLIAEENRFKNELLGLGEVNDEIIYKGEKILKNLEILKRETIDLEASYAKLNNLLIEYQEQIQTVFINGIKQINQSLLGYFYKLYGGVAKLILRNEDKNPGIHIFVEHPQKKIKFLEALSGGEKALFSIALIFALIKISEPPFLVLDEIDAALDEQNSYKFAEFLKELSRKTQFIIVSHNRSTIESADVLFGVSLQKGISKIFSLKLKEALEAVES